MWLGFAVLTYYCRDTLEGFNGTRAGLLPWQPIYGLSVAMLLGVGYKKVLRDRKREAAEAAKEAQAVAGGKAAVKAE